MIQDLNQGKGNLWFKVSISENEAIAWLLLRRMLTKKTRKM